MSEVSSLSTSSTNWDNLKLGTIIRVMHKYDFMLQTRPYLGIVNSQNRHFGISMKKGDIAIVVGYDKNEQDLRYVRLLAHSNVGWYDVRTLNFMFQVFKLP